MTQTIILDELMYSSIIDYARAFERMTELQAEGEKLLDKKPDEIIEATIHNAVNWDFEHTVSQEIGRIISEIGELESYMSKINDNVGFDLRYLTETKGKKYKALVGNYYVYKLHNKDGVPTYYVENVEVQYSKKEYTSKEDVVQVLQEEYSHLDVAYQLTFL